MKRLILRIVAGALLTSTPLLGMAADAMSGKWELNASNSMFDASKPPKSMVREQEVGPETIRVVADIVDADGRARKLEYTARLDGQDYPITGAENADTISFKRIDERTLEYTQKKGGKPTLSGKHEVSEDGAELTISAKNKNADGDDATDLYVFDKR